VIALIVGAGWLLVALVWVAARAWRAPRPATKIAHPEVCAACWARRQVDALFESETR
jgi:hypothetical protein